MKRRSKRIHRALDEVGPVAQKAVLHTSRKTPKFIREGKGKEQVERLEKELVKKK